MNQLEYDFCAQYVGEFLAIIKYPVDDNTVELIERFRERELFEINQKYENTPILDILIQDTNDEYDKQLFDFIKEKVADDDKEFFNERITSLNRLLEKNKTYAERLSMKIPATKIDDYYHNYLIALERTLHAEFQNVIS